MTSTIPTTLTEYQDYVRKEALKIQADMSWPDEKLNETLRALGLPEKRVFQVPIEVTGRMLVAVRVDDAETEEEARASIAGKTNEELRTLVGRKMQVGYFGQLEPRVLDGMPTTVEVGALDNTLANPSIYNAGSSRAQCEDSHRNGLGYWYCTRPHGHDGQHAQGDGRTIVQTWDA